MTLSAATLALRKLVEANLGVVERGLGLVDHHFPLGASAVGVMALDATRQRDGRPRSGGGLEARRAQGTGGYPQRSPRGLHAASPRRRPAERLASDYSQRISTFTLGYSGGFPSTSTIRMLPSWAWSSRLLLL